ncbi:7TM diverse intracellular signaling domain-containing protein [Limibacter armeniacum]|uniref:7TM diverse intracellular signaling domain-containing protein n=1 Tax=Limibacter armeniacum TaxID=466084 RepID=UPI002FE638E8
MTPPIRNKALTIIFLGFVLLSFPFAIFGQAQNLIDIRDLMDGKAVGKQTSMFRDPTRMLSINDIQDRRFIPNTRDVVNIGFTNDACWLKFAVFNPTEETKQVILKTGKLLADTVELFYEVEGGWESKVIGVHIPNSQKEIRGKKSYFPMEFQAGDTTQLYVRIASTYGIQFAISALSEKEVLTVDTNESLIQGFYLGALLIITFYNLFIGFSIKDNVYLHYALANLAAMLTVLSIRGFFSYYIPDSLVSWTPSMITGAAALYVILSVNFSIRMLNLRKYSKHSYYLLLIVAAISLLLGLGLSAFRFSGGTIHNEWLTYAHTIFTVTALYAGVMAYRNGSYYAKYYLMGWTLLLLSILLYSLVITGYIERNDFTANVYLIGSLLEVILLSFALADRYNFLQKERNKLEQKLKYKDEDLAMVISDNRIKRQVRENLLQEVIEVSKVEDGDLRTSFTKLINEMKRQIDAETKQDYFQQNIESINSEFESKLKQSHPELTDSEVELCYLIKLKMTTKEMASFRKTSEGAIKVARHRIRKKLGEGFENQISTL